MHILATSTGSARKRAADAGTAEACLVPGFDFAGDAYGRLFAAAGSSPFQHPLWLVAFWRQLAPARGAQPATIIIRDVESGSLEGVLPLMLRRKNGIALLESCDLGVSDYAAPVVRPEVLALPGLPEAIGRVLPRHDALRIRPARPADAVHWRTLLGGEVRPLDFSAHAVELGSPFDAWRTRTFAPAMESQLARKRRKARSRHRASLRLLMDTAEIAAAVERLRALRAGRFAGDPIQDEAVSAFYSAVATTGAASGFARIYALSIDGEDAGYTFNVTHAGRLHYLLIGCDYERFGRHSPGLLLYDAMMEDWLSAGGTVFDFTIGDEPFKADFGCAPTPMQAVGAERTILGRLALAGLEARRRFGGRPKDTN